MIENDPINKLSFVKTTDALTNYWAPAGHATWAEGCALGNQYADELVVAMRDGRDPAMLSTVLRALRASPEDRAVETGFFARLGEHITAE